jgi:DTW domain-containing protein YfiP
MPGPCEQGRPRCPACRRPKIACLCAWLSPVENTVDLLLLQHPLEQGQAKGSADLLRLSLARCTVWVGESFDALLLSQALSGAARQSLLLYPASSNPATDSAPASALTPPHHPGRLRLVVLDATWRKSRKMLQLNPLLQQLPRLALKNPPPSRYAKLRKAQQAHQMSTLEATVLALQALEGQPERYAPLLAGLDGFVAQQAGWQARFTKAD